MTHHHCLKHKSVSGTPTQACVEYCAVDGRSFESIAGAGFQNLAKQLVKAGATLGRSISINELLPHPCTVSIEHLFR